MKRMDRGEMKICKNCLYVGFSAGYEDEGWKFHIPSDPGFICRKYDKIVGRYFDEIKPCVECLVGEYKEEDIEWIAEKE